MKLNWLIYLVIFSLALNLGTIGTFAYLRHQDRVEKETSSVKSPRPSRSLWRELNLDNSQRRILRDLLPEHHRKVSGLRQALAQKRQELFNLIVKDDTSMNNISSKVQEISALQASLEEETVHFMLAFKKNLNPEQHEAFLKLVQARLSRPGGACGPMRPGFNRNRGPGRGQGPRHGMGQGMGPGQTSEVRPAPMEGPDKN